MRFRWLQYFSDTSAHVYITDISSVTTVCRTEKQCQIMLFFRKASLPLIFKYKAQ